MDEYESLSHTKWECKYHVVVCCERGSLQLERKRCFTEDEGGPSKSACKSRLQTTSSCGGKELPW